MRTEYAGVARPLVVVAAIAVALGAGWFAAASAFWFQTADFFCLWAGGRTVLRGGDPYDPLQWAALTGGLYPDPRGLLLPSSCPGEFAYPLWTGIALIPFGALPIEAAATLWAALSLVAAIAGSLLAWTAWGGGRRFLAIFLAIVLFSQPFLTLFVSGQITGIMLALAGTLAWALARSRPGLAGAALAGLLLKPQLALLVLPTVIIDAVARRRSRLVLSTSATTIALLVASLVVDPVWPGEWVAEVGRRISAYVDRPTVWAFAASIFGDQRWGAGVLLLIVVSVAVLAGRALFEPRALMTMSLTLSIIATPYVSSYDHLALVVPWAGTLATTARATARAQNLLLIATVAAASLIPWVLFTIFQATGDQAASALVPIAAALLLGTAIRSRSHG